jgi:amino acid adenylation domain-containing protein
MRLAPASVAYNELVTIRKYGPCDLDAFRWAFNTVVTRHESWRTTFEVVDGEPNQVVHEHRPYGLPLLDLSHLPFPDAEAEAARICAENTQEPYDLISGPLMRPLLVRLSATHHRLYLGMHHLIFDGVSLYRVVLPELVALYEAYRSAAGAPMFDPLPDLPIQYADYAAWERQWVAGPEVERRVAKNRARLAGIEPLAPPLDHPRPTRQRFVGSMLPISVDAATVRGLRSVAADNAATLFQVLASVFAFWLHRYTERDDVVFATAHDMRQRPELESMVGYCMTPMVLRGNVADAQTFADLVATIRREVLDAMSCAVPFEHLVRELATPRDPRRNPLFQVALVLEPPMVTPDPTWAIHQMETAVGARVAQSKFDISVELDERSDGRICGRLIYSTDLFEPGTARLMQRHLAWLLETVAKRADVSLAELLIPPRQDSDLQLNQLNPPALPEATAVQDRSIHDLILDRAQQSPESVAVVAGDRTLTYRELLVRAHDVASRLSVAGVQRGDVVATYLDRSIDLVPALLGVLMAGGAYLPLDPTDPESRSAFMVNDSGAAVLLANSACGAVLTAAVRRIVDLRDDARSDFEVLPSQQTSVYSARPDDLAYVIYTSGSTGTPKGVQVEHRNVVHLMTAMPPSIGLTAADTVVSVASYTFDMSVGDFFPTLALGARLVVASAEQTKDPRELAALLARSDAAFMGATPTTWASLLGAGWGGQPQLVAGCVGEPLPDRLASALRERCKAVWNGWGPTETTVFAGGGVVAAGEPVTVGRPLPGVRIYVLGKNGRITPHGVPGEIAVAGPGVARGYLNRPQLSAQRFRHDPYVAGERMYLTGDRGRLFVDGRLQHLGRYDDQVKVRGYRVELGEVESVLQKHPDVVAAAAAARDDGSGTRHLVAYVVGAIDHTGDAMLRAWMRGQLPGYMVPSVIVHLSALPVTTSGKLDRSALPAPPTAQPSGSATPELSTATQRRLAEIWADLLPDRAIDAHTDFFDLGGHSVLAARLVVEAQRRLGVTIALADFLDSGRTIAGLAMLVDDLRRRPQADQAAVVSGRPRMFFVYPDLAAAMSLRYLAHVWDRECAVYPLFTPMARGRLGRPATVAGLAEILVTSIRRVQPRGPYTLIGYSFGGLLAYEVARLLAGQGEQIAWLGLLDTPTPDTLRRLRRRWKSPTARLARLREPGRAQLFIEYGRNLRWSAREKLIAARLARRRPAEQFDVRAAWRVMRRYASDGHTEPIHLFVTSDTAIQIGCADLGWSTQHRGPLTIHRLPGDHDALLDRREGPMMAQLVSASVRGVSADARSVPEKVDDRESAQI